MIELRYDKRRATPGFWISLSIYALHGRTGDFEFRINGSLGALIKNKTLISQSFSPYLLNKTPHALILGVHKLYLESRAE